MKCCFFDVTIDIYCQRDAVIESSSGFFFCEEHSRCPKSFYSYGQIRKCGRPGLVESASGNYLYCQEHSACSCPEHHSIEQFVLDEHGTWVCPTVITFRNLIASGYKFPVIKTINKKTGKKPEQSKFKQEDLL